jgi:hypothetical protein
VIIYAVSQIMEECDKVVAEYQDNAAPSILLMSDSKPQTQKAAAKVVTKAVENKEKGCRNGERTASTAGPSNPSRPSAAISPKINGRRVESAPVTSRPIRSPVSPVPNPRITPRKQSPKGEEKYAPRKTSEKAEIIKVVEDCQC